MKNTSEQIYEFWKGFRIERMNETHYPVLVKLLNTAFGSNFSCEYLQKKYATAYLERNNIGYLAFSGNLAVSYQMGLLTPLCYKGIDYLTIQSCDSATHPEYLKRGLWSTLNNFVFQQAIKDNIKGSFGLSNQNSYKTSVEKLEYKGSSMVKCYLIQLNKIPFWKILNRVKLGKWFSQIAEKKLKKYQIPAVSFSSFDENEYLIVKRSPEYLSYKMQRGSFFIKLYDTLFWIKVRSNNLFIGDLKTPSEAKFLQALDQLKSICLRSGLNSIIFQSQEGSFEEILFSKNYEAMDILPMIYKSFDHDVPFHLLRCTYADLDTF